MMNESEHDGEDEEQQPIDWFIFIPKQFEQDMVVTHLTFHPSVQAIPKSVFLDNNSLEHVKISESVQTIGEAAFYMCRGLSKVDFGESSLHTIGKEAFRSCEALQEAMLSDSVKVIGLSAFEYCFALKQVRLPTGLQGVRQHTFLFCRSLLEINLPEGLCWIEDGAFLGCESLQTAKIPNSVIVIGKFAFQSCRSLTFLELPKNLKKIQRHTFGLCERLSGVVLPLALEKIDDMGFGRCYNLLGVEFPKDNHVKIHPDAFSGCHKLVNLCLYDGKATGRGGISVFARRARAFCWSKSSASSSQVMDMEPFLEYTDQLCGADGRRHLKNRFAELPIHQLCYHASTTTVDQLQQELDDSNQWKDYLGMTPFHVVATSANPRLDILECLLSKYPVNMLTEQDVHGNTMMDYLMLNARGIPALHFVLRTVFSESPLLKPFIVEVNQQIEESLSRHTNPNDRISGICEIYKRVGYYIQKEMFAVLEMACWKKTMVEMQNETTQVVDREECRFCCGAQVVIENMMKYWDSDESEYLSAALLEFPFFCFRVID